MLFMRASREYNTNAAVSRLPRLLKTLKSNPMKKLILFRFLLFCTYKTILDLYLFSDTTESQLI